MMQDTKKKALHRTKILAGQMRGIERMIEEEEYCVDILTQILAIQRSLGSLGKQVLEGHIRTHVRQKLGAADDKDSEAIITELVELYDLANVRGA